MTTKELNEIKLRSVAKGLFEEADSRLFRARRLIESATYENGARFLENLSRAETLLGEAAELWNERRTHLQALEHSAP